MRRLERIEQITSVDFESLLHASEAKKRFPLFLVIQEELLQDTVDDAVDAEVSRILMQHAMIADGDGCGVDDDVSTEQEEEEGEGDLLQ